MEVRPLGERKRARNHKSPEKRSDGARNSERSAKRKIKLLGATVGGGSERRKEKPEKKSGPSKKTHRP